jgi:hypothetical protein
MGRKKNAPFYVVDEEGNRRKVSPNKSKFEPRGEATKKRAAELVEVSEVNGVVFQPGFYLFAFWDMPIVDKKLAQEMHDVIAEFALDENDAETGEVSDVLVGATASSTE